MADCKKYNGSTWEHSLRKLGTATDSITTLPADVYADGTNATVGLVGNMSQTGTPTPSSPIQPSECGDLETSGTKAGQYKIPISSAGQTTPVYLGQVQTTRKIKKLVFDGTENWELAATNLFALTISQTGTSITESKSVECTHFIGVPSRSSYSQLYADQICVRSTGTQIWIRSNDISTVTDFKTYLQQQYAAGTPVTVWYVLANETTGIVNEPLRKIGDYADSVSDITIPTTTGKDTVDVETTLKPSEVSLAYTGWHDATVEEWDGSQWL